MANAVLTQRLRDGQVVRLFGSAPAWAALSILAAGSACGVCGLFSEWTHAGRAEYVLLLILSSLSISLLAHVAGDFLFTRVSFGLDAFEIWNWRNYRTRFGYSDVLALAWRFRLFTTESAGHELLVCISDDRKGRCPRWVKLGGEPVWRRGLAQAVKEEVVGRAGLVEAPCLERSWERGDDLEIWTKPGSTADRQPRIRWYLNL